MIISFGLYKIIDLLNITQTQTIQDNEYVENSFIKNNKIKPVKIIDRKMNIKFEAKVDNKLQWDFFSLQNQISLKIGENHIVKFEGKNLSNKTITSTADFFTNPSSVLPYIIKTECFCFIEQTLKSGESQIFTMVFFIDPSLDSDANLEDLEDIVLTYKFSEYKS